MTIDEAFGALKAARRADDGSTMRARAMYVAAIALATAIDGEVTHRLLNQRTEPNDNRRAHCCKTQ